MKENDWRVSTDHNEETLTLIKNWQMHGDREARRKIVEQNIMLVKSVVKRFLSSGLEEEDLMQIGFMGLIKAIDKFDDQRGVKFSTYAVPVIIGEIKTFLRDEHPIKISRNLKELYSKAQEIRKWLFLKLRREPSISEVAQELKVTKEELVAAESANQQPISLDTPMEFTTESGESTPKPLLDAIGQKSFVDKKDTELTIQGLLNQLNKQKRRLIILRFFLENSQQETGNILGLSQVQVSRMERKILKYLKESLHNCPV